MSLRPILDRVVVQRVKEAEMIGLLHLPQQSQEKSIEGVVVAVGPGKISADGILIVPEVKVGDRVIFQQHSGTEIIVNDEKQLVLSIDNILCVLE